VPIEAADIVASQPGRPPNDTDVARLVATIARRIGRLLRRRGLDDDAAADPLAAESRELPRERSPPPLPPMAHS
jgi:hypothetical protein